MRVAIVGGGVAGLSAAIGIVERGHEAVVLEATGRAGGKVATIRDRGFLLEDGPSFLARRLDGLLDRAGLRGEVVFAQPPRTRFVHLGGKVLRAPALLARAGTGRALLEPFFAKPVNGDGSLLELLTARFGAKAGALAATLMAAGVYAGDPSRLSARDAFPRLGALAARGSLLVGALQKTSEPKTKLWSLRGGLGTLAGGLAALLGDRVRLQARVHAITPAPGGWLVEGERFDGLVLALPAPDAARLLDRHAPAFAAAAGGIRSAPISVVHLGFPEHALPRGFGLLDADGTLEAIGTLFPSSMLEGRAPKGLALATALVGGALHPERAAAPDDELAARVISDLRRLFGARGEPAYVRVVRHGEAIPQVAPGHRERVAAARAALADLPSVAVCGASYDGVGVADVARSGTSAAEAVIGRAGARA